MADYGAKRVLIVDDSAFHLASMRDLLTEAKFEVLEAGSGKEAMEILVRSHEEIDLMITDLDMPHMSGFDLLSWFKDQPFVSDISTLVLTGAYDLTDLVDRLKDLGVSGVLEKGGHPQHILARVNTVLFPDLVDRRKYDRVSVHLNAVFEWEGDQYDAVVTNLSLGGCFIVTQHLAKADDHITLLLTLPFKDHRMSIGGVVTWVVGGDKWHGKRRNIEGMGIKWADLPNEERILLEVFIEERMKTERLFFMLSP